MRFNETTDFRRKNIETINAKNARTVTVKKQDIHTSDRLWASIYTKLKRKYA